MKITHLIVSDERAVKVALRLFKYGPISDGVCLFHWVQKNMHYCNPKYEYVLGEATACTSYSTEELPRVMCFLELPCVSNIIVRRHKIRKHCLEGIKLIPAWKWAIKSD